MSKTVLAITEQREGAFRKVSYESLSQGRRLADELGGSLIALILGQGIEALAEEAREYGPDRILLADDPGLADYLTDRYTQVAAAIARKESADYILLGASSAGRDLAARLSARLDGPLAMDCVALRLEGTELTGTRPMYGGKVMAELALSGSPQIAALRPNAVDIVKAPGAGAVETVQTAVSDGWLELVEKQLASDQVELTEADTVVSGGRGMGGSDFRLVEELAAALNGAVGASRSAVDEGWRPHSDQVGQTGKVVSPNLYFACGISGAIQHLAGMSGSKVIVAINKDPEAPIFSKADYGVVGDLFEILPAVTAEIKKLKAS